MTNNTVLHPPFPYYGGKRRVASAVWERFGCVDNYVEPFFGAGAVLLGRPHPQNRWGFETVNDLDVFISNFWRSMIYVPVATAAHCDYPIIEADLYARHKWLLEIGLPILSKRIDEPKFCDPHIAGWWAWGISCYIGGRWCVKATRKKPRTDGYPEGVHAHSINRRMEDHSEWLWDLFRQLQNRLRNVRVLNGDWARTCRHTDGEHWSKINGVFFDPPYAKSTGRESTIYARELDDNQVHDDVRSWCISHGNRINFRIALCGLDGEHNTLADDHGWSVYHWSSASNTKSGSKRHDARHDERIWFSPHCIGVGLL